MVNSYHQKLFNFLNRMPCQNRMLKSYNTNKIFGKEITNTLHN